MKIYDSLSNKNIEVVEPITIYCCGPTVYNDVHIGNIRPIITFDVLNRFCLFSKKQVKFVHNITDIDDKIIKAAKQNNENELTLSNRYYLRYLDVLKQLNIDTNIVMPKVSENIDGLINYIQKLIDLNHAYVSKGDVYFDVRSISNYGLVSHQKIDELMSGVRIENSSNKKSNLDFALWKETSEGINWDSPWSKGRPGWHSECSYFINKYFGKQVEIHGGGIDLKFPHHENENAQNLAISNVNIAKIWMHVGHINIDNKKMAKSEGNFILAKDLLQEYSSNVLRWFMYQTQYENPINFTKESLNQLQNDFSKLIKTINQTYIDLILKDIKVNFNIDYLNSSFISALENDLNFPNAVQSVWSDVKSLRSLISKKDYEQLAKNLSSINNEFKILGLKYENVLTDENLKLINEWKLALTNKDFVKADKIRNSFIERGII